MSEIDLNQPIFQTDYVRSQRQSIPNNRQSQEFMVTTEPQHYNYSSNQINLFKPNQNYRMSETTISKRSSPLKINTSLLKSTQNPFSSQDAVQKQDQKTTNSSLLGTISQSDTFQCQHKLHMNSVCQICKGKGYLKGDSNLIKFFQHVIGFKFGINQSYSGVKLLRRKKTEVNGFCSQFFSKGEDQMIRGTVNNCGFHISSKSNRSSHGVPTNSKNTLAATNVAAGNLSNSLSLTSVKVNRESMNNLGRMSYKSTKKCCKQELMDQINNTLTIHQDYVCDQCQKQPIIGPRYHCNDCEDYDLCTDCYHKSTHQHIMEKIQKSSKCAQLQNVVNLLVQPITSSGRVSLRPPPMIDEGSQKPTTKSAIR